jgi:hypothetical protein
LRLHRATEQLLIGAGSAEAIYGHLTGVYEPSR